MAKNFTQFQEITGLKVTDGESGNVTVTSTAERDMYVVGYADNEPDGERRYTLESIIHLTDKSDVGLEHATNESKETMFTDPAFTSADEGSGVSITGDLTVTGDFTVVGEGSQVVMETTVTQTSAMEIENNGTDVALKVIQTGNDNIAEFKDGAENAMVIGGDGNVGIGVGPQGGTKLTVAGAVEVGSLTTTGDGTNIQGRDLQADGDKLDTVSAKADVTVEVLGRVFNAMVANGEVGVKGLDKLEDGDIYHKTLALSANKPANWWTNNSANIIAKHGHDHGEPQDVGDAHYGTWDASEQKLYSIESEADVTGAHSEDIIFADIPDGPWNGNTGNSFVKMLSAESDKLRDIHTVDPLLTNSNTDSDVQLLTQENIVDAYQSGYGDFWSSDDELDYRNTFIPAVTGSIQNSINSDTNKPYEQDELKVLFGKAESAGLAVLDDVEITSSLEVKDVTVQDTGTLSIGTSAGMTTIVNIEGTELHFVNGLLVQYIDGDA